MVWTFDLPEMPAGPVLEMHGARKRFHVPTGLKPLIEEICLEVLRYQPDNIYEFCAIYLESKLTGKAFEADDEVHTVHTETKRHSWEFRRWSTDGSSQLNKEELDIFLGGFNIDIDSANKYATKIQAVFRGHRSRKWVKNLRADQLREMEVIRQKLQLRTVDGEFIQISKSGTLQYANGDVIPAGTKLLTFEDKELVLTAEGDAVDAAGESVFASVTTLPDPGAPKEKLLGLEDITENVKFFTEDGLQVNYAPSGQLKNARDSVVDFGTKLRMKKIVVGAEGTETEETKDYVTFTPGGTVIVYQPPQQRRTVERKTLVGVTQSAAQIHSEGLPEATALKSAASAAQLQTVSAEESGRKSGSMATGEKRNSTQGQQPQADNSDPTAQRKSVEEGARVSIAREQRKSVEEGAKVSIAREQRQSVEEGARVSIARQQRQSVLPSAAPRQSVPPPQDAADKSASKPDILNSDRKSVAPAPPMGNEQQRVESKTEVIRPPPAQHAEADVNASETVLPND